MAIGDFVILEQASTNGRGSRLYNVALGGTAILAGEPVSRVLGATNVTAGVSPLGVVGTDFMAGIAQTASTQTATLNGSVEVIPVNNGTTYLVNPAVAATWDTQTKYDNLVGKRMTVGLSGGLFTLNATDNSANAFVVMPLDVLKYPGKVAVTIRAAESDVA